MATTNSEVSIEPTTLRGSSLPLLRSDVVPTGPQPPPPTESIAPATRPSGARNLAEAVPGNVGRRPRSTRKRQST